MRSRILDMTPACKSWQRRYARRYGKRRISTLVAALALVRERRKDKYAMDFILTQHFGVGDFSDIARATDRIMAEPRARRVAMARRVLRAPNVAAAAGIL